MPGQASLIFTQKVLPSDHEHVGGRMVVEADCIRNSFDD